jgi:hypothetical protein
MDTVGDEGQTRGFSWSSLDEAKFNVACGVFSLPDIRQEVYLLGELGRLLERGRGCGGLM